MHEIRRKYRGWRDADFEPLFQVTDDLLVLVIRQVHCLKRHLPRMDCGVFFPRLQKLSLAFLQGRGIGKKVR